VRAEDGKRVVMARLDQTDRVVIVRG
jgi:hypothetical protein